MTQSVKAATQDKSTSEFNQKMCLRMEIEGAKSRSEKEEALARMETYALSF